MSGFEKSAAIAGDRGSGGPNGYAHAFQATANAIAAQPDASEAVKAKLAPHLDLFCEVLISGVRRRDRTAMNLFPRLLGLVGATQDMAAALLAQLGVQSLEAAKRTLDMARDASAVDDRTLYEKALAHVMEYRRRNGMPPLIEGESRAVIVEE